MKKHWLFVALVAALVIVPSAAASDRLARLFDSVEGTPPPVV